MTQHPLPSRAALAPLLGAILLTALPGCSLLFDFEDCGDSGDCEMGAVCTEEGLCRSLVSAECNTIVGPFEDPRAIRLGAVFPLSGENAESGRQPLNAITLAIEEINRTGGVGGAQSRPLALLACDDASDPAQAVIGADHLSDVVGAPAILGSAQSRITLTIAEESTIDRGVLLMSASSTAVDIANLDDDNLVWRTAPSDTFQTETLAYYALWALLEMDLEGAAELAIVHVEDTYGQGFAQEFRSRLDTAASVINQDVPSRDYRELPYDASDPASVEAVTEALVADPPDLVLVVGFEEAADIVRITRQEESLRQIPFFVTDGVRTDRIRTLFLSADEMPSLLFGSNPAARQGTAYDAFASSYLEEFGGMVPPVWTEHTYDAVYLLAYALAGVEGELDGAALAEALGRISDDGGTPIRVGPSDFIVAADEMGRGGTLDVSGASGALDFDSDEGELRSAQIVRWTVDPEQREFIDCGVATVYAPGTDPVRMWCNALCLEDDGGGCVPDNAP